MRTLKQECQGKSPGATITPPALSDLVTDFIDPSLRHIGADEMRYAGRASSSAQLDTLQTPLSELRPARGSNRVGFREFLD